MDKKIVLISLILFFILIIPISFSGVSNLQHYQNSKSSFYTGGHPAKTTPYPVCDPQILKTNIGQLKKLGIKKIIVLGGECLNPTTKLSQGYLEAIKSEGLEIIYINMGAVIEEGNKNIKGY